jgi:CRP/FNR family transcriptional regulator, cyclic AMP receptor protein
MACDPETLRQVPLFALLDDDEMAVLAGQVELQTFAPRHRIYRAGEAGGRGYIVVSGAVRVTTVDEDQQEVVVDEPSVGEFFGFASMLDQTPHQTSALAAEEAVCIEVDRHDIMVLLERKPHAGMDMLAVLGKQYHGSQRLVRLRSTRNPNEVIEERASLLPMRWRASAGRGPSSFPSASCWRSTRRSTYGWAGRRGIPTRSSC